VEGGDPEDELIQFIADHLHTVPHLEALLLIWQNASTPWTADLLASRVYVAPAIARQILEDLSRQGVVRSAQAAEATYIYEPGWDSQRQMLPRLADLYRRQLVQVTKLIHSRGSSSVREFARAFQIKKDP
jgi:predicted ArsR family transcriptional regulator